MGLDKNTDNISKTYYFNNDEWHASPFNGSLMIRPVFGTTDRELKKALLEEGGSTEELEFSIYPNPAIDEINIQICYNDFTDKVEVLITDLYGKVVFREKVSAPVVRVDLSGYKNGMYVVRVMDSNAGTVDVRKLVITK